MIIAETIEAARAALRGAPEPVLVPRDARGPVVAFLVTLGTNPLDQVVVPLFAGSNVIGRHKALANEGQRWPSPHAVESSQWVVICEDRQATIEDARSTNLSAHVPRSVAQAIDLLLAPWAYARDVAPEELARRADRANRGGPARPAPVATFPCHTALLKMPGAMLLPHPNDPAGRVTVPLAEGDVVCSGYAAFAFAWWWA